MRGIRYRSDGDVTVLVVSDSESELLLPLLDLVAAFAISRVRGRTYAFLSTRPIMTRKGGSVSPLDTDLKSTRK
jgi:hypothetical protein